MSTSLENKVAQEQQKIGQFITKLRVDRNITQTDLAKALKTSQSAVARMEKGHQNFTTEILLKISQVLNKSVVKLASNNIDLKIEGGHKLAGEITVNPSKNSITVLLCASLLNKGKTILKNAPRIEEAKRIIEVLKSIGVKIKWLSNGDIEIVPPQKILLENINKASAKMTRSIIMFIAPLLHHMKEFSLPKVGGCELGNRSVVPHFYALEKLGVNISESKSSYNISYKKLKPNKVVLYESGDTVTENIIMAAAIAEGETIIKFASANYQVQDLCFFLRELGVKIKGIGTTTLVIYGKKDLKKNITYYPSEDPIEAMLFLSIAATTNSSIDIKRAPIDFLELELLKLEKMGFKYEITNEYKGNNGEVNLVDIKTLPSKLTSLEEKIYGRPYPGLNIDNLPFFAPIATQAQGTTLLHDWVFENRAIYFMELAKLGADVIFSDPHRVYIKGKTELNGAEIICPPALRPAVIILIAMLQAKGTSILRNVYSINRGYGDLVERLKALGAKIEVLM